MNRDQIAEVIAREVVGVEFAKLFANKTEYNRARGLRDGHAVDVDEPRQCDILDAADAILALDGWQPIESAPRDGTEVLLWAGGDIHQARYNGPSDGAIYSGTASRYNWFSISCGASLPDSFVRFWRPLPPPPGDAG